MFFRQGPALKIFESRTGGLDPELPAQKASAFARPDGTHALVQIIGVQIGLACLEPDAAGIFFAYLTRPLM